MQTPSDRRYAKSHEWARLLPDGQVLVGITDYAQSSLGDITYVQLPAAGTELGAGDVFGVVESVKAASDLYAPIAGKVVAVNGDLASAPETVNRSPFDDGWMLRLQPADPAALETLLAAEDYAKLTS